MLLCWRLLGSGVAGPPQSPRLRAELRCLQELDCNLPGPQAVGGLHCSPSPQHCVAVCAGLCLSFPGVGGLRAGGHHIQPLLTTAVCHHWDFFSRFLGACITTHRPLLEMLSVFPVGHPNPCRTLDSHSCFHPLCQELPQVLSMLLGWGPGPARCPGYHCSHDVFALCFIHGPHTRGLCCSYGVDPLVIGIRYLGGTGSFKLPHVGVCLG